MERLGRAEFSAEVLCTKCGMRWMIGFSDLRLVLKKGSQCIVVTCEDCYAHMSVAVPEWVRKMEIPPMTIEEAYKISLHRMDMADDQIFLAKPSL